jgi:hypothetical protein
MNQTNQPTNQSTNKQTSKQINQTNQQTNKKPNQPTKQSTKPTKPTICTQFTSTRSTYVPIYSHLRLGFPNGFF